MLGAEYPQEALPLRNSNPKNFCVKTVSPTNAALNKIIYTALTIRLVSRNVSIIAQISKGNLPHFIMSTFKLLTTKGPLLSSDKSIKAKNNKRNKNNILLAFILVKSGDKTFLSKKKVSTKLAKVPIIAIEIGIKNISP
jgi:hypothetical protein